MRIRWCKNFKKQIPIFPWPLTWCLFIPINPHGNFYHVPTSTMNLRSLFRSVVHFCLLKLQSHLSMFSVFLFLFSGKVPVELCSFLEIHIRLTWCDRNISTFCFSHLLVYFCCHPPACSKTHEWVFFSLLILAKSLEAFITNVSNLSLISDSVTIANVSRCMT